MAWLEVETKVKLDDKKIAAFRKKVEAIAKFAKKGKKADDYFAIKPTGRGARYPKKAFRIRAQKDHFEVNFKKWLTKYWDNQVVVKQEFEFSLTEKDEVDDILALFKDLGFAEWVRKEKYNETYKYNKDKTASIEINKVKNLGYFMEIEYLCQKKDLAKARRVIREILKKLEIKADQIDNVGYTKMLWYKGTKEKKHWLKF